MQVCLADRGPCHIGRSRGCWALPCLQFMGACETAIHMAGTSFFLTGFLSLRRKSFFSCWAVLRDIFPAIIRPAARRLRKRAEAWAHGRHPLTLALPPGIGL